MVTELKTFRVTCDFCKESAIIQGVGIQGFPIGLPAGWESRLSGGWGKTDYTKTEHLCPKCKEKENG